MISIEELKKMDREYLKSNYGGMSCDYLLDNLDNLIERLEAAQKMARFYGGTKSCRFCVDGKTKQYFGVTPPTKCPMCNGVGKVLKPDCELAQEYIKKWITP